MNAHELKRHIVGVEDTVKITRAMQMIATSKLNRARDKCENSYRYLRELRHILAAVASEDAVKNTPSCANTKREKPRCSWPRRTKACAGTSITACWILRINLSPITTCRKFSLSDRKHGNTTKKWGFP